MKQALLSLIMIATFAVSSFSQVNVLWESRYDNAGFDDYSEDIVLDAAGNSYVVGTSYDGSKFEVVAIKYDSDGNVEWTHTHNGPAVGLDEGVGIVIDSNDDVIIGGHHQISTADFDIFLKKLDGATGNVDWTYTYGGTGSFDQCADLVVDGNDNIIAVGGVDYGGGNSDFAVISVNSSGNLNWSDEYSNGGNRDFANAVTVDPVNNVYVTGESQSGNGLDYYTIKYNPTGGVLWNLRTDGNGNDDRPQAITVANDGNTYVVGNSYRGLTEDDDIMLIKINNAGGFVWDQVTGGTDGDIDRARSVNTDDQDNVYITGSVKNVGNGEDYFVARYFKNGSKHWDYMYQSSSNGFDEAKDIRINANYEVYVSGYSNVSGSSDDYFTVRLDTLGGEVWTKRFDGPASNSDQMSAFEIDDFGNIFVTGSSSGSGTLRDYSTIKYCQLETIASDDDTLCVGQSTQLTVSGGMNYQWSLVSGDPIDATNFSCTNCDDPIASPDSTSTYAVSSENGTGCIDYDTVVVVVNPLPGPNISTSGSTSFCDGASVDLTADPSADYDWNTGQNTQTITADTSGTYSLTVTDSMGCENSTNIQVTVFPNPTVDGGPNRFRCPGDSLELNGTGADNHVWYSLPAANDTIQNSDFYTPSSTMDLELVGTTNDGCEDRDTITVTLYPNPMQVELSQGMSGNLFVNTNNGDIDWFYEGQPTDSTGFSFYYQDTLYCNGIYGVTYTDENNCQTEDTILIDGEVCEDTANVAEYDQQEAVSLYPNPTSGAIYIEFTNQAERSIVIFDATGNAVMRSEADELATSLELGGLAPGTYMIRISSANGVINERLIKQ